MLDQLSIAMQFILPVCACVFLTVCYVASLYVWRYQHSRDHPSTIRKRFISAFSMMIIAPFFSKVFIWESTLMRGDMYQQLGLREKGLLPAVVYPLILTFILFFGPVTMQMFSGIWRLYVEPRYWLSCATDLVWLRNHIVAPLSEEWVFRACMMPLLLQCMSPLSAVFFGPILFGVAHFHHMLDQIKDGTDFKTAFTISSFQFTYTSLFGAYSAFLFARTGHLAAPLVAHIFCNHMGFPNIPEIFHHNNLRRGIILINFILGFVIWCLLLYPLTEPAIYDNTLHWND